MVGSRACPRSGRWMGARVGAARRDHVMDDENGAPRSEKKYEPDDLEVPSFLRRK